MDKAAMLASGRELLAEFCEANRLPLPELDVVGSLSFGTCAYYRPSTITISPSQCAGLGRGGMAWSWPGYVIDRTPHGVVQHELGHHVDHLVSSPSSRGAYWGDYSIKTRRAAGEDRLTSYCPNDAEWFAEMYRLFVTNSDLLRLVRPRTYALLRERHRPVVDLPWQKVLEGAPARTVAQAAKKISLVQS